MEDGGASLPVPSPAVIQALQDYLATVVPPVSTNCLLVVIIASAAL